MFKNSKLFLTVLTVLFMTAMFAAPVFAEEVTVTLSISPADESDAGEDIVFSATAEGVADPEYQFGYRRAGGSWTARAPGADSTYTRSTPAGFSGGEFQMGVRVREAGTSEWLDMDTVGHTINPVTPAVTLTVTPADESELGDAVTLTASSEGVTNPEFRFGRKYTGGSWRASSARTTASVSYTPKSPGSMDFAVQVREAGGSWLDIDRVSHTVVGEADDNDDEVPQDAPVVNYDQAKKVDEIISLDGGELSLTDAKGNRFVLHIPEDAITGNDEFSMIAVKSIDNFPMSGDLIGGVGLQPDGLSLLKPATLVMTPANPSALKQWLQAAGHNRLSGYMHGDTGEHLHFYPFTVQGDEIHFSISCLRGLGIGLATDKDNEKQQAQSSATATIKAKRAAAPIYSDLAARHLLGSNSAVLTASEKEELAQIYNQWFDDAVGPLTRQGENDDEALEKGIIEYLDWVTALEQAEEVAQSSAALTQHGLQLYYFVSLHDQRNQQARSSLVKGIDNAVSELNLAANLSAANTAQANVSGSSRLQRWAAVADTLNLPNYEKILDALKKQSESPKGMHFSLTSTMIQEEVHQVSVAAGPIPLEWTADWRSQRGSGAIRHTDYCSCHIEQHEDYYVVNYTLTPGTINIEVFWAHNRPRIDMNGNFSLGFPTPEEHKSRTFANIIIMGIQSGTTYASYEPPHGPFTIPAAPLWLGYFSTFHQEKLGSGGMMFRGWVQTPGTQVYTLSFEQQIEYVTESTEMTLIHN